MNTENNRKTRKEHLVLINQKFNEVDCLIINYLNEARRMEANKIKTNARLYTSNLLKRNKQFYFALTLRQEESIFQRLTGLSRLTYLKM